MMRIAPPVAADPPILPLRLMGAGYAVRGTVLLDGVTLAVPAGRRLLVLGANGAGKSLLLRLCHGLIAPTAGRVVWAGGGARPAAQAMVFQRPLMLRRSVRANLAFALDLSPVAPAGAGRAADLDAALERFGLAGLADRPARRLSGGEQQRVALARAWIRRPQVLFLDEPTAALDPSATARIESLIAGLGADGITVVMATHDLGQARRLADDIVFLHRGRLAEHAPAAAFFAAPSSVAARAHLAGDLHW